LDIGFRDRTFIEVPGCSFDLGVVENKHDLEVRKGYGIRDTGYGIRVTG
jgi:hypothetical protein